MDQQSTSPTVMGRFARPLQDVNALQLQAYLLAREAIRRVRPARTPCIARETGNRSSPTARRQPDASPVHSRTSCD
jgi:hypothetical protein